MISVFRSFIIYKEENVKGRHWDGLPAFDTLEFLRFFSGLSSNVVPEYRKERSYISSLLSKNEVDRKNPYNKKLFLRIEYGLYVPKPLISINTDEGWVNIYDLIKTNDIIDIHLKNQVMKNFIRRVMHIKTTLENVKDSIYFSTIS